MSYTHGISVHVTIYVAPENVDAFFAAFEPLYQQVIREPECLSFEVYRNPEKPGKIVWVEDWSKSPSWFFHNQLTKDYYKEYLTITQPMLIFPREAELFERLPPKYCFSRVNYQNYGQ
ncbi:hypothetical protein F4860DRAFT_516996 [Xylaria cubensis]|nr:hypothetical protein F4860DRAFT_516996 [Xylaria cubensis]